MVRVFALYSARTVITDANLVAFLDVAIFIVGGERSVCAGR